MKVGLLQVQFIFLKWRVHSLNYFFEESSPLVFKQLTWLNRQDFISYLVTVKRSLTFNPLQPRVAFPYPLKTENLQVFRCFQGVQKSNTGLQWESKCESYLHIVGHLCYWKFTVIVALIVCSLSVCLFASKDLKSGATFFSDLLHEVMK